jgi:hypothetical protein
MLGSGSWFCSKCGYVMPDHKDRVRELQTKLKFLQGDTRTKVPDLAGDIGADEYIIYCHTYRVPHEYIAVMERGLTIRSLKHGKREFPWSQVAAVGDPRRATSKGLMGRPAWTFEVQTLGEPVDFWFDQHDVQGAFKVHSEVVNALRLHNADEKPIGAIILSLKMEG